MVIINFAGHVIISCSRLSAELQASRSSRSSPSYHRLRPIMRSRERRAMMERWGALSGTGEVPEELVDQVTLCASTVTIFTTLPY